MSIDKCQSQNSYNQEVELILYCSRTNLDEQTKAEIQYLANESLDWKYIFITCLQHKVAPLVFNSLKQIDTQAIPPEILDEFSSLFNAITVKNLSLASELLKILEIFESEKIPVIPFKGVVLAASAYEDLALRHFGDLDMLIEENNIFKAIEIFTKLGYPLPKQIAEIEKKPFLNFDNFRESGYYQGSFDIVDRKRRIALELHWTLLDKYFPFPVTFRDLWQHKDYVNIAGNKVPHFASEDLLIYICVHSSKHCWSSLNWICDVNELIRANPNLDWHQVENKASQWGCQRMLHIGLILAHKLLNTALPKSIIQILKQDRVANVIAENVAIELFSPLDTKYKKYVFLAKCRERVRDKLIYLLNILFAPSEEDWNYLALPKHLRFFYYFIRPYRLVNEYLFEH